MTTGRLAKFSLLALGAGLLAGCAVTGPGNLRVHEATLYGAGAQRIVWVYGDLGSNPSSSLKLGQETVTLRAQVSDPLATPGSLSVNGKAAYVGRIDNPVVRLTLGQDAGGRFTVTPLAGTRVQSVYYTDGARWQKLSAASGLATASSANGLRGAGQLTDAEADALTRALSNQGVLAVAVLDEASAPDARLSAEPTPQEQRRTALYVLSSSQITRTTTTSTTVTQTQTTTGGGQSMNTVNLSEVARGTNASAESPSVIVARNASEVRSLYGVAYGRQTGTPALPSLTSGEALVGLFIGQRGTGGYGVRATGADVQGNTLNLRVELTAPGAGSITTQAITSPWVIVRVGGNFSSVNVTDQSGRPFPQ
ncbi:protease complex subunit PrcB family protein [Deinococcus radiodurans]|jgi:hypothetical protein|uniref:PrcB C-terminal domain-containing protein n=1 Tax=Deinococcus radiodurans (strain ATCC 13939 / DSM 20539 / JCM 16871 / CCUG 27074 / LMG 4051 / NBRC 15346 / NCIMB 9279 / VKM B-1422 / R1) TaxID=243230 RepID=Q9RTX7_DEIRA|nr:protease complex subunit PrcB family protein [Deinococcus radiodurans]AAF11187.1 hypothetical protein DR_1623 [Deinococcus radiodurans R1 = ATCC 13939 = DSM 20539]ANC71266.1 hypothetical protein A2G07_05480 [Deinococcus radiodurans R1 = ATCC 13939 = DSM 20539]QEM71055.1 protease complex subunit PrcB family protein [Deinococcus radiodurans]UDL00709.1 protease complex subunit PrcB family protein [Deinococcus radiodurans R1 = ATCC 13939 = DSM 20539]UID70596.1 hypothetical protein DRO_1600 [Dei